MDIVFSPHWFFGYEISFGLFSFAVSFLLALFSFKIYLYAKTKTHKLLLLGFLLMSLSFLIKLVTEIVLFFNVVSLSSFSSTKSMLLFFFIGIFLFRFLFMYSLTLLYVLISKTRPDSNLIVFGVLELMIALSSAFKPIVFNIVAALFLFYIYKFFKANGETCKLVTAKLISVGYLFLLLSQLSFILLLINLNFYVLGEILQMFGFFLLLISLFKVLMKK